MNYGFEGSSTLIEVHIADIHFGAMDPKTQYDILIEQFLNRINQLPKIDIISINGDLFDHKVMSNSDVAMYASLFINDLVNLCRVKNSTLILLHGTFSHDNDQLKIFYHYISESDVDVRIVTSIKFEEVKGARILCIPELYGVPEEEYQKVFNHSGWYDTSFIHGTFKGAVYGDNVGAGRLLVPEDFRYCKGPAIAGHVHKPGCFSGFYYYCGCPYRWKFGEEEDKGFLIVAHNLDSEIYYISFEKIESFRYDTIMYEDLISEDPKIIIDWINDIKEKNNIDFIKIKFKQNVPGYNKTVLNNYYRNNKTVTLEYLDSEEIQKAKLKETEHNNKYNYLIDNSISDFEKFVMYVNEAEGEEFITVDKLKDILSDKI